MTIRDLPDDSRWILVVDTQSVRAIHVHLAAYHKPGERFDGYFVIVSDGDYTAAYGFNGVVPTLDKALWPVKCWKAQVPNDNS